METNLDLFEINAKFREKKGTLPVCFFRWVDHFAMARVSFTVNPEPTGLFFWITDARQILSDRGQLGKNAKTKGKTWKKPCLNP